MSEYEHTVVRLKNYDVEGKLSYFPRITHSESMWGDVLVYEETIEDVCPYCKSDMVPYPGLWRDVYCCDSCGYIPVGVVVKRRVNWLAWAVQSTRIQAEIDRQAKPL